METETYRGAIRPERLSEDVRRRDGQFRERQERCARQWRCASCCYGRDETFQESLLRRADH